MNVQNNHLISEIRYNELSEEEKKKYNKLPAELTHAAKLELMGKEETTVGQNSTGSLSEYAKKIRKIKNKMYCKQ